MDDSLEYLDDGLRNRIRVGFGENTPSEFEKTEGRPKTPGGSLKKNALKRTTSVLNCEKQNDVDPLDKKKIPKPVAKKPVAKKPVVRKPNVEVGGGTVSPTVKTRVKKTTPSDAVYLCLYCDKTYKSKSGVLKHMEKCKPPE
jgi:hypothetical protein